MQFDITPSLSLDRDMKYVEVAVATATTVINEPLTYETQQALEVGQVVRVPLASKVVPAVVLAHTSKPMFNTKPIKDIYDFVLPDSLIELAQKVASYYGVPLSQCFALLVPSGLEITRRPRSVASKISSVEMQDLSSEQVQAINSIQKTAPGSTSLLHGDTGTGKTRVYIKLAQETISSGRGVIILVPEIGLTPQLKSEFDKVFGKVYVLHSRLTEAERHLLWMQILTSHAPLVIGPRSAIFAPINHVGLIVVDEAHEQSYKQDKSPKYSALRVAKMRSVIEGAKLVLGSATPLVEDMYLAETLGANIIRMQQPASGEPHKVATEIVDLSLIKNRGRMITTELQAAIESSLKNNLQSLIFHNRRGTSTSVICELCGNVETCINCLIPLTFHQDQARLRCHICGFNRAVSITCSNCKKAGLVYKGFGTKQIEMELKKLFPMAKIIRFDGDSRKKDSLSSLFDEIKQNKYQIIVGTQMIAKGLDLPSLETVGVVQADSLMYLPDYSSSERFFQLVYQVMGRVGRHRQGKVIIQTYNPDSSILRAAAERDYETFYRSELEERRQLKYPPFSFVLSLLVVRKNAQIAQKTATDYAERLKAIKGLKVLGPAPAFHEKSTQGWRWQLVIKSTNRNQLLEIVNSLPARWQYDIDPYNLLT